MYKKSLKQIVTFCHFTLYLCNIKSNKNEMKKFNMEILRVENLSKIYGKGENEVRAVDKVSFSVEKGEFIGIIMRYSLNKINKQNIIETIRKDNI